MKFVIYCIDFLAKTIITLFVVLMISAGALSSLLRFYLPHIDEYRERLVQEINDNNKKSVIKAEKIQGSFSSFKPQISFHGVSVESLKFDQTLHLDKIEIKLDILKTILNHGLYVHSIELSNLTLFLYESDSGEWSFSNEKSEDEDIDIEKLLNKFWSNDELKLRNVQLILMPYQKEKVVLPLLQLNVHTTRDSKHAVVEFVDNGKQLSRLILQTSGGRPSQDSFFVEAYWKSKNYPLYQLSSVFFKNDVFKSGNLTHEIWMKWENKKLAYSGYAALEKMDFMHDNKDWMFKKIKTHFSGEFDSSNNNFSFNLPELDLAGNSTSIMLKHLEVSGAENLRISFASLELGKVLEFIHQLPMPEVLVQELTLLSPKGMVKNGRVNISRNNPFVLNAELENVSVNAWGGAPGLTSVNGFVHAEKDSGQVLLETSQFSLFFPKLYKVPMEFNRSLANIHWQITDDKIKVSGKDIMLESVAGIAHGEFQIDIPHAERNKSSPELSLAIGVQNSNATFRNIFIPYILHKNLLDWLDKNIRAGELPRVGFIYHGPVDEHSIEKPSIQLWLDLKNAAITYMDKWPGIESINGYFLLDNENIFADIQDAETEKVKLLDARIHLFPEGETQRLDVNSRIDATSAAAMNFLKSEALSGSMSHVMDDWKSQTGNVSGDIVISTLLAGDNLKPDVKVNAQLDGVNISIPANNIQVNNVAGSMIFELSKGLSSDKITGTFFGKPIVASIASVGERDNINTSINVDGKVNMLDVAEWSGQPVFGFLSGITSYHSELYYGISGAGLKVTSSLQGVDIHLPEPFAKTSGDKKNFTLQIPFSGDQRELKITYDENKHFSFLFAENGIEAGKIYLGEMDFPYLTQKIIVTGNLDSVEMNEWLDVVTRYKQFDEKSKKADVDDVESSANKNSIALIVNDLAMKKLRALNKVLDDVVFNASSTENYWQMNLNQDQIKADIKLYNNDQPMDVHLTRLNVDVLKDDDTIKKEEVLSNTDAKPGKEDNRSLAMNIVIDELIKNGEQYGDWKFKYRTYADHTALEDIQANVKAMRVKPLKGVGPTLSWTSGDNASTNFVGRLATDDLADVLKAWGYAQEVHSKKAYFDVHASWVGAPTDFAMNKIQAKVKLNLSKGNFADVSNSGTSTLKLLGIFNLSGLMRRIELDFSDLTSDGLAYDKVTGTINLDNGVYNFEKPIRIKSPTSKINITGGFDKNTDVLDMKMGITLPLASNLPWFVALAAGLPVAVGVYIVSKVLNEQVDKLLSVVYTIKGSFDVPEIKFDSLFDAEGNAQKATAN